MADIFMCSQDGKQVYQMPWLPELFPQFSRSSKNEVFETYNNGDYNNLGAKGLLEFSLEGKLPINPKSYSFSKSNVGAYKIINLMAAAMSNKKPIRIIVNRNKNQYLPTNLINILVSIETMTWQEVRNNIVTYNVSFKEYVNV